MSKILITGTAGFIGHHLALKLSGMGHEVVGLDSINDYYDVDLKFARLGEQGINRAAIKYNKLLSTDRNISFIQLQLEDRENLHKFFEKQKFQFVVNLAAQAGVRYSLTNPYAYTDSNILGFINILEACRHNKIQHLSYASSSSVYGLDKSIPFSESHHTDHPVSLYAATKKANELMAHTYSHLYDLPTTGLRFFTVYGPWGRPDMALFIFTKAILEGKPIDVFNFGKMKRDFTYITDIVEGVTRVTLDIAKPDSTFNPLTPDPSISSAPYRIFNIGNNSPLELMDFIKYIEEETGKTAQCNMLPLQAGDVTSTYADVSRLMATVDFKPNTPVREGVKNFIDWYKSYYKVE